MIQGRNIKIINSKWDRCARKFDLDIGSKSIHPPLIAPTLVSRYDMQIFFDFITKGKENSTHLRMLVTRLVDIDNTMKPIITLINDAKKAGQRDLEGKQAYAYIEDFTKSVPIIVDPCSEYTYYGLYRKEIATNPIFPIEIRKLEEKIMGYEDKCRNGKISHKELLVLRNQECEKFWLEFLDDEHLLADVITKILNNEHRFFADIGLPPVPAISSTEFLEVTKRINRYSQYIWKGENCASYVILTPQVLENEMLLNQVMTYLADIKDKFIVIKCKNLELDKVSHIFQRHMYKKILETINRIKRMSKGNKVFILLEAGYQLYPSIAGGFDIACTTLRGYDRDTPGWGKPENAGLGSWYDPKYLVFRGIKDVNKMLNNNGGNLRCKCAVCKSISKITPRNEWNRSRREHYLYVLGDLVDELSVYIDNRRMELAVNKLTKSALSNFKNMLPLLSED